MTRIRILPLLLGVALLPGAIIAQEPSPTTLARAERLTAAMEYDQAFEEGLAVCREKARDEDVAVLVAKSPEMFGGIVPGDEDWPKARNLYLDMLATGCAYSRAPAIDAFTQTLAATLSDEDMEALVTFYGTGLGQRFRRASHAANRAAGLASQPLPERDAAYEIYAAALNELLAGRQEPKHARTATHATPVAARPIPSADEAVALSDRVMQSVGGDVRGALDLLVAHSVIDPDQLDPLIDKLEESMPMADGRYGKVLDYELLRNDTIGDSVMRLMFLQRRERYAMNWQFVWYRGDGGWLLSGFRFADDLGHLF
ncbi:DUF2059 domain-containing protein [Luteimonas kalidii]|uniref:DUF2059 domain-containing protein n=1 Tax=Luteimonas kalidii TaxID=3042025 RepID=A0ABT6JX35_9GAMM|nr:DUF2059 domain-containing protein [Luteimonas kalidii]MDH5835255.1 DUF2059 domain-containing protein [Luteimonas kalidii]